MRELFLVLPLMAVMSACSNPDIFGPLRDGYREVTPLTATWRGEAAGLRITLTIDSALCDWYRVDVECSTSGRGTWKSVTPGDTGSFLASVSSVPSLVGDPQEIDYMFFGHTSDTASTVEFNYQMPDSLHLTGRIHSLGQPADSTLRPLLPVDSSFAITLSRVR